MAAAGTVLTFAPFVDWGSFFQSNWTIKEDKGGTSRRFSS
jgi:hypothetical protein